MAHENDESPSLRTPEDWLRVVLDRRWWIAIPAFTVWTLVWCATWFVPSVYRSETLIMVEPQKIPDQYVISNTTDIQKRLESLSQQIESRSRLVAVIEKLDLYPEARKKGSVDDVIDSMRKDLDVEPVVGGGRSGEVAGFRVSYRSRSPKVAQQVTQLVSESFINENVNARTEASENTTDFLDSQLDAMRQKLASQEETIRNFKNAHLGQLPAQLQPNLTILQGLQTRLEAQIDGLNRAKQQILYYESMLGQYRSIQTEMRKTGGSPELPSALDRELTRMKSELADLSGRYTDAHPDVKKLKQQIAATEAMKKKIGTRDTTTPETHAATSVAEVDASSPMIQVESQLKASRMEVIQREKDIQRLSAEIAGFQGRIDQTPVREQQLADITRDYDQSKKEYDAMLAKRNQSELATNLVQRQQGDQFRILDPASLPSHPISPKRLLLSLGGLAAGFFFGILIAGFKEFYDDLLRGEKELTALVTVPLLAQIPVIKSVQDAESAKSRWNLEIAGAACMVVAMFAGLAVTYLRG
jgi:polysaccharide biosynthesis transport protein